MRAMRSDAYRVGAICGGGAITALVDVQGPKKPLRIGRIELPSLCAVRALTGRRCPGCGMSRGFAYLLRLDIRNAMRANPLSPLLLLLFGSLAVQSATRLIATAMGSRNHTSRGGQPARASLPPS
jgi:hypothetical protein